MKTFITSLLGLGVLLTTSLGSAKTFRNAYISFELPDAWNCKLEHTEWVCRSEIERQNKEAIIILTAKEVGPTDSLEQYLDHLSRIQATAYRGAGGANSRVIYKPKKAQINDQVWIDGLHLGSEVPNYFTRYLATVKDRIAVLVTLSAHKDFYTQYSPQFFKAVESLRVIATSQMLNRPEVGSATGPGLLGNPNLPGLIEGAGTAGGEVAPMNEAGTSSRSGNALSYLFIVLALLLAGGAGYVYFKSKRS